MMYPPLDQDIISDTFQQDYGNMCHSFNFVNLNESVYMKDLVKNFDP